MNYFHSSYRRAWALMLLTALLLPLLSTATLALPSPTPNSSAVWNGGAADSFRGSGTQSKPYLISTAEELALLAQKVRGGDSFAGAYFLLTTDLYLNDITAFDSWEDKAPARRWIPIGGYSTIAIDSKEAFQDALTQWGELYLRTEEGYQPAKAFQNGVIYYRLTTFNGIFNGDGHTVYGLYSKGEPTLAGLFGACKDATIETLSLSHTYVHANETAGGLVGALIGQTNLTIDQCHVNGIVIGDEAIGGLVGSATCAEGGKLLLNASSFSGTVSGTDSVGGILGISQKDRGEVQITACENLGTVTADKTGGGILGNLLGENNLLFTCYNRGSILCKEQSGGIVGKIASEGGIATVSDCLNSGTLLGNTAVGGIVGEAIVRNTCSVEILSCRNVGEAHAKDSVGGIVGSTTVLDSDSSLQISGCKNSALIQGNAKVGGIIGSAQAADGNLTVGSSENYGSITAAEAVGGILGYGESFGQTNGSLHLYQCSARSAIIATLSGGGGIAGLLHSVNGGTIRLELSSAGGTVKAPKAAGGIVGEAITGSDTKSNQETAAKATSTLPSLEVRNCLGAATVSGNESAGGIVGLLTSYEGHNRVISSLFCGSMSTGCKVTGGIAAIAHAPNKEAIAEIKDCYFNETTSARAVLLQGGEGRENCLSTSALPEDQLRNPESLPGLDFTAIWQEGIYYPTLQNVPFVWEDYTYTVTQNGAILLSYTGRSDIARIPEKLGGIAVTTISQSAFLNSEVIRVILPDSITAIGEGAFQGCNRLEQVTLSQALVSIGARAFKDCSALCELRCSRSLSTLQVGSENEPFHAVELTQPVAIQLSHNYEDGTPIGKTSSFYAYIGDFYQVSPLEINGYEPDEDLLSGICQGSDRISVVYRIGTYHLTIRYLFPDGSEAFPAYQGDFQFGQSYSIPTPALAGFMADRTLIDGIMDGKDAQFVILFTQVYAEEEENDSHTLEISLLIVAGLVMVCCVGYFIHRYRVMTDLGREIPHSFRYQQ